jgi:hypothetical protein
MCCWWCKVPYQDEWLMARLSVQSAANPIKDFALRGKRWRANYGDKFYHSDFTYLCDVAWKVNLDRMVSKQIHGILSANPHQYGPGNPWQCVGLMNNPFIMDKARWLGMSKILTQMLQLARVQPQMLGSPQFGADRFPNLVLTAYI